MPTTDIPTKGRAAGTASRCGPLLLALRLLREAKDRTRSPSENVGQGVGTAEVEPPACAAPPPSVPPPRLHCGSPPPTGSYCGLRLRAAPREARAAARPRFGGLALGRSRQRSATARCGATGSRKSWKGEGRGGGGATGREAKAVARQRRGSRGLRTPSRRRPLTQRRRPPRRSSEHRLPGPPARLLPVPESRGRGAHPLALPPRGAPVRLALRRLP